MTKYYTNSTTVYAEVTIDGNPAAAGDMVGVFDNNGQCRGTGEVFIHEGCAYVTLLIQGESIETVNFKVYDASRDIIVAVNSSHNLQTSPGNTLGTQPNYVQIPATATATFRPGDVDHMDDVNLKDAILSLKVITGIDNDEVFADADVNNDGRIGIQEAVYILQVVAEIRQD